MAEYSKAKTVEEFLQELDGWVLECVEGIRRNIAGVAGLDERIKWGNIVYFSNGPAVVIRAEGERVVLGFWRGKRLREIEPRLKPGGKYEMASLEIRGEPYPEGDLVKRLALEAVALNARLGNPQLDSRKD